MAENSVNENEEVFFDADHVLIDDSLPTIPDTDKSHGDGLDYILQASDELMKLYFSNKPEDAKTRAQARFNEHPYFASALSIVTFSQAMITLDPVQLEESEKLLSEAIDVCNRFRKKDSVSEKIGSIVGNVNYDAYTRDEVHAEICYAECTTLKMIVVFFTDSTLKRFLKESVTIYSWYQSYRKCWQILHKRNWDNDPSKSEFEGGIHITMGIYNIIVSLLPSSISKVIAVVGIRAIKEDGLCELEKGHNIKKGIRHLACTMFLTAYNVWVTYIMFNREGNVKLGKEMVNYGLEKYPKSCWFLLMAGRAEMVQGNFEKAVELYVESWKNADQMVEMHQLCFSELSFVHTMMLEWKKGALYLEKLLQSSSCSKIIYSYYWAALKLMVRDELTDEEIKKSEDLFRQIPSWKRTFAGYAFPLEVLVEKKCRRYFAQGGYLPLPAIEFIYLLYGFVIIAKRPEKLREMYNMIENSLVDLKKRTVEADKGTYCADNACLLHLLKGACLTHLGSPLQAEECFQFVYNEQQSIKEDYYLVPFSLYEMGTSLMSQGFLKEAGRYLTLARNGYKNYNFEIQLSFRIQAAVEELEELQLKSQADLIQIR